MIYLNSNKIQWLLIVWTQKYLCNSSVFHQKHDMRNGSGAIDCFQNWNYVSTCTQINILSFLWEHLACGTSVRQWLLTVHTRLIPVPVGISHFITNVPFEYSSTVQILKCCPVIVSIWSIQKTINKCLLKPAWETAREQISVIEQTQKILKT